MFCVYVYIYICVCGCDDIQFVATTVKNFLLFGMGMCQAFPGIVIPALTGIPNEHNRNESLSLSAVEASWLGK